MSLRSLLTVAIASLLATDAHAQSSVAAPSAVGVWRGTSVCLVRPSSCNDEIVVYRITRMKTKDSLLVDADRIVNGQEEEMGALTCHLDAPGTEVTCAMRNGVWHFTVRADSLVGELRLPDNRKFRDVRTVRAPK